MIKTTINDIEFQRLFEELRGNVTNLRPALIKIGGMLENASEEAFERQGPGWKPLKPATKHRRKKLGKAGKILQFDGNLASSVSAQITGPNSVAVGSNLVYARPHQLGSPKQGIPKREFLKVGPAEIKKSLFILSKHLLKVSSAKRPF